MSKMLDKIRSLADVYTPPIYAAADDTYVNMLQQLRQVEEDIRLHIAKEDEVLHVKVRDALKQEYNKSFEESAAATIVPEQAKKEDVSESSHVLSKPVTVLYNTQETTLHTDKSLTPTAVAPSSTAATSARPTVVSGTTAGSLPL
jgi:hypothetical protein